MGHCLKSQTMIALRKCPRNLLGVSGVTFTCGLNLEIILPYLAGRAQKESPNLLTLSFAQRRSSLVCLGAAGPCPHGSEGLGRTGLGARVHGPALEPWASNAHGIFP